MVKDGATARPILNTWIQQASGFRDALLVGIGLAYALGFITWSYSALEWHMGFMNALDAQYVVAGVIPTIPIFLVFLFYTSLSASEYGLREQFRGITIVLFLVMAILHVLYALYATVYHISTDKQIILFDADKAEIAVSLVKMAWYGSFMLLAISLLQWLPDIRRYFAFAFVNAVLVIFILIFFVFCNVEYAVNLFPNMSAEIGGGQPRCASLDLEKEKLAEATTKTLKWPAVPIKGEQARNNVESHSMIHIENVWVVYSSDKTVLFKRSGEKKANTFEVARSAVSVMTWCSDQGAIISDKNPEGETPESECRCNIR